MRLYTSELVKKYKARTVVNHVSIDVNQGEIVGLLGPNGAGKTTTFYMIVGLIKPNEGQIFLEDDNGQVPKSPSIAGPKWVWGIWRRRPRFSAV
jgi:lipopolysaccharide export system ATP-binding protein